MSFRCRLVNPIHLDPALLVEPSQTSRRWLLDCGDLHALGLSELMSVTTVLITHGHIDHWIGFDALLRAQLFCAQTLRVIGPAGLLAMVQARLHGYAWNLVADSAFVVEGYEWREGRWSGVRYRCCEAFRGQPLETDDLPDLEGWDLRWAEVEHGVPCLAYRLQEPRRWRFLKERSPSRPGPWVERLKASRALAQPEIMIEVDGLPHRADSLWPLLEELPPESLAYVTDTRLHPGVRSRLRAAFGPTTALWCEAAFLESQRDLAEAKLHATAAEAAQLALELECAELRLFHLSRRTQGDPEEHLREARALFPATTVGEHTINCNG